MTAVPMDKNVIIAIIHHDSEFHDDGCSKGQLISKCPIDVFKSTKKPTKNL